MNIRASIAVSLLSTLALALLPADASSTDYESMLNGFLGRGSVDNHRQAVVQNNINTRQGQIEQDIAAGVASGQLTPDEAADVKAQLDGVANMLGQYLAQNDACSLSAMVLTESLQITIAGRCPDAV
jgi:hypothetical protein